MVSRRTLKSVKSLSPPLVCLCVLSKPASCPLRAPACKHQRADIKTHFPPSHTWDSSAETSGECLWYFYMGGRGRYGIEAGGRIPWWICLLLRFGWHYFTIHRKRPRFPLPARRSSPRELFSLPAPFLFTPRPRRRSRRPSLPLPTFPSTRHAPTTTDNPHAPSIIVSRLSPCRRFPPPSFSDFFDEGAYCFTVDWLRVPVPAVGGVVRCSTPSCTDVPPASSTHLPLFILTSSVSCKQSRWCPLVFRRDCLVRFLFC